MNLAQKIGPIDDQWRNFSVPIRLQVYTICGRSHANVYNVHVQSAMVHYITMSRAYTTANSVRNQENKQNSPDLFPRERWGLGTRLNIRGLQTVVSNTQKNLPHPIA